MTPPQKKPTTVFLAPGGAVPIARRWCELVVEQVAVQHYDWELATRSFEPGRWTLSHEVGVLDDWLCERSLHQVHLVGHSGAASLTLALAARRPERALSLTLSEPPWIGADPWSDTDVAFRDELERVANLPGEEVAGAFTAVMTRPGVTAVGPRTDAHALMALRAVAVEYQRAPLDRETLRTIDAPVLLPVGLESAQRFELVAEELANCLPDARILRIPNANHFNLWTVGATPIARAWFDHVLGTLGPTDTMPPR